MIAQRRDANEDEIVAALQAAGCLWIPMDRRAGFDGVVVCPRTGNHICEVKDPAKKWKLTPAEARCKAEVEQHGGTYHILESVLDALVMVKAY